MFSVSIANLSSSALLTNKSADNNESVHIRTHHLLGITRHDSLAGYEVFWSEDRRCSLQWHIWSVHKSAFKERGAAASHKDNIAKEVRVNNDIPLLAQRACLDSTNGTGLVVMSDGSTESSSELKNVSNFWRTNDKVCTTTKGLAMNLSGHIIDGLAKSLIPFAYRTGEVRGSRSRTKFSTSYTVHEETRCTRPVVSGCSSTIYKVSKDLAVDFQSNLLRKNAGKLNLSIKVVVSVKVLT